jgi:phosphatidylserine decarboxylase
MTRFARRGLSRLVGWATDRRVPRMLRGPVYRGYARFTGADLTEVRLALADFPSLGAFFVRELKSGARPIDQDPAALVSPVDGRVQSVGPIDQGSVLQAKGRSYAVGELVGGSDGEIARGLDLDGGFAWTLYLSPRDYHRIHAPVGGVVTAARWITGDRFSVAPAVLDRRRVLDVNERAVLRIESRSGTFLLVLVGAMNVGRIRVVGVPPTYAAEPARTSARFERGAELARFEMGSTIVLIAPRGVAVPVAGLSPGDPVRLGTRIGHLLRPA